MNYEHHLFEPDESTDVPDISLVGYPLISYYEQHDIPALVARTKEVFEDRGFKLVNYIIRPEDRVAGDLQLIRNTLVASGLIDAKNNQSAFPTDKEVQDWIENVLIRHTSPIVDDLPRMRNYVKTRLFVESDGEKAADRLRALENMGKLADMGMYADRVVMSVEHKSTEELAQSLNDRLAKYMGKVEQVKTDKKFDRKSMIIDLDLELGLNSDSE